MSITAQMIKELREATGAGVLDCKKALTAVEGDFERAAELLREKGLAAAAKKAEREAKDGLIAIHMDKDGRVASILEVNCETDFVARTEDFQSMVGTLARQVAEDSSITSVEELGSRPYAGGSGTVGEVVTELISKLGENIVIRGFNRLEHTSSGVIDIYLHPGSKVGVLVEMVADKEKTVGMERFREVAHDISLHIAWANPSYFTRDGIPAEVINEEKRKLLDQLEVEEKETSKKKPDHIKDRIIDGRMSKFYEQSCLMEQPFVKDSELTVGELIKKLAEEVGDNVTVSNFVRMELGEGEEL